MPCVCWRAFGNLHEDAFLEMREWDRECPGILAETEAKIEAIRAKRAALRQQMEATAA